MTDLEQTDELPAVCIRGCIYDHSTDYAAGPDQTVHAVRTAAGYKPVSALFAAAIGLLREEPDQLAALCKLADAFPKATLAEVCQTLREVAVMLHAAEVGREDSHAKG